MVALEKHLVEKHGSHSSRLPDESPHETAIEAPLAVVGFTAISSGKESDILSTLCRIEPRCDETFSRHAVSDTA